MRNYMKSSETLFVLLLFPKLSVKLTNILASLCFEGEENQKRNTALDLALTGVYFRGQLALNL